MLDNPTSFLKKVIETEVFVAKNKESITSWDNLRSQWQFDFRRVLLRPIVLKAVAQSFMKAFGKETPFQVGGIEVAALPLITGLAMSLYEHGIDVNSFFIRKSRKKFGLQRMVEGAVSDDRIILVDDIMNSGKSFIRQVEVIESLGKKVHAVFVILRFRDLAYYSYFHEKGIKIVSLFALDDFASLEVANLVPKERAAVPMPFKMEWYFKSEKPAYFHVVPKSKPAIDDEFLYVGSDSGNFWALRQQDGSVAWSYTVLFGDNGKYIFSSPTIGNGLVYFGAYDGNFYALDKKTGKKAWVFMEADWIASSPCLAPDQRVIYVGLEFGLWKRQGGVAALDAVSGKKKWVSFMEGMAHAPTYSPLYNLVLCGSNDTHVYAFDAKNGEVKWRFKTEGEVKGNIALDEKRGLALFGSFDATLYALDIASGALRFRVPTQEAIFSNPLTYNGRGYCASLDKKLYCFDLETGKMVWEFSTKGRIFASPVIIEKKLYIGSNDGRLYELDPETGKETAFFQAIERITNAVAYNPVTKRFFVPTFANEIYCLSKKDA